MPRQVIIIEQNGALKGLEHKERGLDLKCFGKAVVERITSIEWDTMLNAWFIRWESTSDTLLWGVANRVWGKKEYVYSQRIPSMSIVFFLDEAVDKILFKSYNDAQNVEVAVIQQIQRTGLLSL